MARAKLLLENFWSSGTVTGLSAATALPVTFSQSPERTAVYRSLSQTNDQYLLCDFGSVQSCDYVAVANLRTQNSGAVKLYEGGSGGSPGAYTLVATLPTMDSDTRVAAASFAATAARHWKLEWTNAVPATPDYVEAGYIGLGPTPLTDPTLTPSVEWERIDPSIAQMSVDGQKSFTELTGYYAGSVTFPFALEAEATIFHGIWRTLKRRIPFFFALDTDIGNQQWLMRFEGNLRIGRRGGATPIYTVTFDWEEAR